MSNLQKQIDLLRRYNEWRRGGDGKMENPQAIGEAIDYALDELERRISLDKAPMVQRLRRSEDARKSLSNAIDHLQKENDRCRAALEEIAGNEGEVNAVYADGIAIRALASEEGRHEREN